MVIIKANVGPDNTLREHVLEKHKLMDDNGERFRFHCVVIGGTLFGNRSVKSAGFQLTNNRLHRDQRLGVVFWMCEVREALDLEWLLTFIEYGVHILPQGSLNPKCSMRFAYRIRPLFDSGKIILLAA